MAAIAYRSDMARTEFLSNPDQRIKWQSNKLPTDDLCTENAIMLSRFNRYPLIIDPSGQARTALFLRTEKRYLRDDKMRPLFQEAIVTKLLVTQSASAYQMKATDIIFPMILHESLWAMWFRHHSPVKLGIFPK